MKKLLLTMFIVLFAAVSAFCGDFDITLKKAEQGDALAQHNLGLMYYDGKGITQNFKLAYVWFNLSAAQGDADAIKNKNIIAKLLSSQQLSEAQDLAAQNQHKIDNP